MRRLSLMFFFMIALVLAACSSTTPPLTTQPAAEPTSSPTTLPVTTPTQASAAAPVQQAGAQVIQFAELTDSQGAVTVVVKPHELNSSQDTLSFEVSMDTHSIDLSMDLAALARLTTETGLTVQATQWDAPLGGHHVSGTLTFPSSVEGKSLLDGATALILIIKDVDAPERVFKWELR